MNGDSWINESLRDVTVPDALSARLREIGSLSDGDLDAALRHALPRAQLRDRLLAIGTRSDADLDDELRLVEVSPELLEQCRRIALEPSEKISPFLRVPFLRATLSHARPYLQYIVAATLLFIATGIAWRWTRNEALPIPGDPLPLAQDDMFVEPADLDALFPPKPNSVELPAPPETLVRNPLDAFPAFPDHPLTPTPDALGQSPAALAQLPANTAGNGVPPEGFNAENVFGTSPDGDALPDLLSVREPEARGIRPPAFREYDLIFQLRHGVHPFVAPSARAELATVQIPLSSATTTFDYALDRIAAGRSPAASQLRVEDFLAAMDYEFPKPTGPTLGLRTAAGISPWSAQGLGLIQLGVQAGDLPVDPHAARRLTLLIETSSAMSRARHWNTLIEGLTLVAGQLTPQDRLTVIAFGRAPETLLTDATPAEFRTLLTTLSTRSVTGTGDLAAGLRAAFANVETSTAESTAGQPAVPQQPLPQRIVLFTAGTNLTDGDFERLTAIADRVLPTLAQLDVFDLRGEDAVDPRLATIAAWSRNETHPGTVHAVPNGRELAWRFRAALEGRVPVIAHDVTLRVTFVPEAVALYRLYGHEATAVAGLVPLEWRTDLRSGETATALFEVALRPAGPETIAHAVLEWRDPSGKTHSTKQPISRLQFAPSISAAPWSLQLAAFAAETGEVLRGSYFAPVGRVDLGDVANAAERLPERLRDKSSLRALRPLWTSETSVSR